ncbi:MAG: T9SS type A sorting domain-containing protein [Bacteroidetes bacterium]|nr:T9SS type A sorting domain-containing protein [Bacteroidota bacterium]
MRKNKTSYYPKFIFLIAAIALLFLGFMEGDKRGNSTNKQYTLNKTQTSGKQGDAYRFFINNINMPMNRIGTMAAVNIPPEGSEAGFGNGTFLFSGGFFLSGLTNGNLWAFAQATASLIENMTPGTVESGPNDPDAVLYVVNREDEPFGFSWQDWKDAVDKFDADFYDGNGDGEYNPVDLNGNGVWDPDEDMPDLLGDETVWCVYTDGQPGAQRLRFAGVNPQGIEIRQTVFGFASKGALGNMIFIRYRIRNSGLVADVLDSVYFGAWADPDLGVTFDDDLVGVDVPRNAGFTYNGGEEPDPAYGTQIPSFFMDFLSGPAAYIPGETFIDNDGDGIYTPGIDDPLDTAYTFRGQLLGIKELPGAKNLDISSFVHYIQSDPLRGDPNDEFEARNYGLGRLKLGELLDPCNDNEGGVFGGVDCSTVDPLFWYSGDPVTNVGWINTGLNDQRQMTNVGPFTLRQDEEVEVLVAYVVGQGTDRLNSITVARNISDVAQSIYDSNFDFPVSVQDETPNLPTEFSLSQNYPNPFNPSTIIKFSLPSSGYTTLKIYNALGEEVVVLLDKELTTGTYEIEWNATDIPNGVYFYQLQTNGFLETKKMLLLK